VFGKEPQRTPVTTKQEDAPNIQTKLAPLILFASRLVLLVYSVFFALIVGIAILARHSHPIFSFFTILFFAPAVVFYLFHMLRGRYFLKVTEDSLELTAFARSMTMRWTDIKSIRLGWAWADNATLSVNKRMFITFRKGSHDQSFTIWPIYFGLSARELVDRLRPYCADYPKLIDMMLADVEDGIVL
jgi:hypothetical protein